MRDHVDTDRRAAAIHLCRGLPYGVLLLEEDTAGDLRVIRITADGRETLALTPDLDHARTVFAVTHRALPGPVGEG